MKPGIKDDECFPEDFAFSDSCANVFDTTTDEWQFDRTKVLRAYCSDVAWFIADFFFFFSFFFLALDLFVLSCSSHGRHRIATADSGLSFAYIVYTST